MDGLSLYIFALIDDQAKQLALNDGDLLVGVECEFVIFFILSFCIFYDLRYLIKPHVNQFYYLFFDDLLIPLLIVLRTLRLTDFLGQRYVLKKN